MTEFSEIQDYAARLVDKMTEADYISIRSFTPKGSRYCREKCGSAYANFINGHDKNNYSLWLKQPGTKDKWAWVRIMDGYFPPEKLEAVMEMLVYTAQFFGLDIDREQYVDLNDIVI